MGDSLSEQANKAALAEVKAQKPQSFTVGGSFDGKRLQGGVTYDRRWSNAWGLTAYLAAWYDDLPVSTHTKLPKVKAGVEVVRRF